MSSAARRPFALVGLGLVGLFIAVALAAPLVSPFDPVSHPGKRLSPPGGPHLLGTDEFGRDVLSRVVYGARVSLQVGLVSVGLALALGGTLGPLSGYYVGLVDHLAGRLVPAASTVGVFAGPPADGQFRRPHYLPFRVGRSLGQHAQLALRATASHQPGAGAHRAAPPQPPPTGCSGFRHPAAPRA